MKINFSQVPAADVDVFGEDGLFGPDAEGNYYYNYVEFGTNPGGTDEIAIVDGCGRFMPIAVENLPELIRVLRELNTISQAIKSAEKITDYATSNAEGYSNEDGIEYEPLCDPTSWPFHN